MSMHESKYFIVEIGAGDDPFPTMGERKILAGEVYLGLDNESRFDAWRKVAGGRLRKVKEGAGGLYLAVADATCLPLPAKSVDEIVMNNVFGDSRALPRVPNMIWEVKRVLKSEGLLTVIETITPSDCPIKEVESRVIPLGFGVKQTYKGISTELLRYYPKDCIYDENPFCVIFQSLR